MIRRILLAACAVLGLTAASADAQGQAQKIGRAHV